MEKKVSKRGAWVAAARPRTLPLALASIFLGSFLAAFYGAFEWEVLLLAALTTVFLQVLSNLANDYGDSIHGADSVEREGPSRSVQAGHISAADMRKAMILFACLSFISGVLLLAVAIDFSWQELLFFLGLGVLAIIAAITYTSGKRPYGYAGLGDISVFVFFGLVGVLGTFYLHTGYVEPALFLPAASSGFFATAVLNLNNIRDIRSDKAAGKLSIPVRIGRRAAVFYHWLLLGGGLLASAIYVLLNYRSPWQWLFLLSVPLLVINAKAVKEKETASALDPYLKQMALATLAYVITFGIGHLLAK
ncbi:1,4-dihydroxy-2-naphthoate polyprenyltransferase [Nafulsella turpanensis]|uniref:1,4-dihydroxy-2-naphthoate polyprenyltransferase n=1 Tax=Nafulsella turpanensis TaxID=1265690 RepID=UPI000346C0B1|nr:1,4-dihydroxy-2-naphthoate polyprenyltransferase [Nafulsella turpanensis]